MPRDRIVSSQPTAATVSSLRPVEMSRSSSLPREEDITDEQRQSHEMLMGALWLIVTRTVIRDAASNSDTRKFSYWLKEAMTYYRQLLVDTKNMNTKIMTALEKDKVTHDEFKAVAKTLRSPFNLEKCEKIMGAFPKKSATLATCFAERGVMKDLNQAYLKTCKQRMKGSELTFIINRMKLMRLATKRRKAAALRASKRRRGGEEKTGDAAVSSALLERARASAMPPAPRQQTPATAAATGRSRQSARTTVAGEREAKEAAGGVEAARSASALWAKPRTRAQVRREREAEAVDAAARASSKAGR